MKLLMLLIGGNNIGNYALIDYFKKNKEFSFDKVVLIYTSQSKNGAKNIIELQKDVDFLEINLENNSRNLQMVKEIIYEKLRDINPSFIHLNYTGGTKPMAIGTFLAVEEIKCEKRFSDISPDSSKLTFLNGEIYPKYGSIADGVELNIKDLYKLHGIELISLEKEVSSYFDKDLIKVLYEISVKHNTKKNKKFWKVWDSKNIKEENWLETLEILPLKFNVNGDNLKDFQNFIRGRWLEEYIFSVLKNENFTDIAWNVVGKINSREFELDIVITKGHQAYMISCTTATSLKIVKQKAFEASIRAEQIGGIRTIPISVSLLNRDNINKLQDDVKGYVGKSGFSFIGKDDLLEKNILKQKFKEIFNER